MTASGSFTDPTVYVALIGGCVTLLAILLNGWVSKRRGDKAQEKIAEIHVMVNSQMTRALARIDALEAKLGLAHDEAIPGPPTVTERTPPA